MFRFCLLAAALAATAATTAQPPQELAAPACGTVQDCIAALRDDVASRRQVREPVALRLAALGAPAAEALIALLADPSPGLQESAGLALTYFDRVDPRHLPALVRAWREGDAGRSRPGNGWLPKPIAATGTDEALRLLWADFERDPEMGSNAQTFFALARGFGDRVRPLVLARIAACRDSAGPNLDDGPDRGPCAGTYQLLGEFRPPFPDWSIAAIVELAANARSDHVREAAEATLAARTHPAALAPLQRRLAALQPATAARQDRWTVTRLIRQLARYGAAARDSGRAIVPYLAPTVHEDLRADAALALGRIDARDTVPALLALAPALTDDWLLAYNVAESLGRLRASEARPLLERLASDHWHRGVRRNATRALNAIAGGAFAVQTGAREDDPAYGNQRGPDGEEYSYFGDLRFTGDDAASTCRPDAERDPVYEAMSSLPPRGAGPEMTFFVGEAPEAEAAFRRRVPQSLARGGVRFAVPARGGNLVGFNGGEFGGGLIMVPQRGAPRSLIGGPMTFAWLTGDRVYVAAGLAHLSLDTGHLYVVDRQRLRIERSIRLPASPQRFILPGGGAVIVQTAAGQLAIRPDGRLVDVEGLQGCAGG